MTEHRIIWHEGRSSLRATCTCGERFGRATGMNGAGYAYATAAFAEDFIAHLVKSGVVETREVRPRWAQGVALAMYVSGKLLGISGQLHYDDRRASLGSWGYMRGGRWYTGRYANRAYSLLLLWEKLAARAEAAKERG